MKIMLIHMNGRGQITLPKKLRDELFTIDTLTAKPQGRGIFLEPLQTRDEFILELERRSQNAKNGKTYSLDEVDARLAKHHAKRA